MSHESGNEYCKAKEDINISSSCAFAASLESSSKQQKESKLCIITHPCDKRNVQRQNPERMANDSKNEYQFFCVYLRNIS